ncbi:MAG: NAD(+)/NADH kinase [Chloroflexaceae bacterium]|nr:NAD(+)/NADH kinase [Chloroflexaceae bacterium]
MTIVGIIANPASGKDIRRLVAHGSVFDNEEKVNIVRRVLCGLDAMGVERVLCMPESYGIGLRAMNAVQLKLSVRLLEMPLSYRQEDSQRAAALLAEIGAGCIVTLGGDGTNRMVAKGCGDVPLMPISTGTNNVFPLMIEGTIAGLAAGLVAVGLASGAVGQVPRIEIFREGNTGDEADDIALVDAVVYAERFVASRAVWDAAKIRELVLTRAEPGNIGLSAIGGHLVGNGLPAGHGLFVRAGLGERFVHAPIAPGLVRPVAVAEHRPLAPGDEVTIRHDQPTVLALDGERELELRSGSTLRLRLSPHGPHVVDPRAAIALAAAAGRFLS